MSRPFELNKVGKIEVVTLPHVTLFFKKHILIGLFYYHSQTLVVNNLKGVNYLASICKRLETELITSSNKVISILHIHSPIFNYVDTVSIQFETKGDIENFLLNSGIKVVEVETYLIS